MAMALRSRILPAKFAATTGNALRGSPAALRPSMGTELTTTLTSICSHVGPNYQSPIAFLRCSSCSYPIGSGNFSVLLDAGCCDLRLREKQRQPVGRPLGVEPRDEFEIRLRRWALRGNLTDLPDAIHMILRLEHPHHFLSMCREVLEVDLQERTPTQWIDYFRPVAAGRNRPLCGKSKAERWVVVTSTRMPASPLQQARSEWIL